MTSQSTQSVSPSTSTVSVQEYIEAIENHSGASFLMLHYDHLRFLGGDTNSAVLLAHLLNILRMKLSNKKEKNLLIKKEMWFKCPAKSIQAKLCMGRWKFDSALSRLIENNLIETDRRNGNFLWIRVNTVSLNNTQRVENQHSGECLDSAFQSVGNQHSTECRKPTLRSGGNQHSHYTNKPSNKLIKKTHTPSQAQEGVEDYYDSNLTNGKVDTPHKIEISDTSKVKQWAKLLWNRIEEKRLLNRHRSKLNDWIKAFRILQSKGPKEGPIPTDEEIDQYLKDFLPYISANMDTEYCPVVHSAAAFCEKFHQVRRFIDKKKYLEEQKAHKVIEEETGFFRDKLGNLYYKDLERLQSIPADDEWRYGSNIPEHLRIPDRMG